MEKKAQIKNTKVLEFVIFCIENVAIRLNVGAEKIYNLFTRESNVLYDYIITNYAILHTQDKNYIVDDILDVIKAKKIAI